MKILATVQARSGSSRLPGKVLRPIVGKPMLELQIERLRQSRLIDEIAIATTTQPGDDAIEALAKRIGVSCFRGSENDVLSRVAGAVRKFQGEVHLEFQGDSPLPDPVLVDSVIGYYLKHADRYDYVTNALKMTYPPGMDVCVYPARALFAADERVTDPALREYVGVHIFTHPELYRVHNLEAPPWFRYPDFHLEVDTAEDFEVVSAIFEHFYGGNPGFGLSEILAFLKANPGLAERNKNVERRWRVFHPA